ncbi:TolC family protein, partial [Acidithiobacillus ferriphilus]|uniref:TolC family protein n=1 Tax=Acidithiobacillus ferriphilus TaxID=1689834 RepID=UPI001C06207F
MKSARYLHGQVQQKAGRSAPGMARLGVLLGVVAAAGCAVGPHLSTPAVPAPKTYNAHPINLHSAQQRVQWTTQEAQAWWSLFRSTPLNDYIRQAMQANPDVQAAQAALAREQSLIAVAQGGLLPSVGAGAGISRGRAQRTGANGGASYRIPGNLYSLLLGTVDVHYSPDVFGRQADLVHAAKAQAAVSRASLHQSEVFLAAAVSRAVISGAAAQAQLNAAQQIAAADAHLLHLLQQEYQLGYQNLQSVDQQEAITAAAQARIAPLQADVAAARHGLAALLGQSPDADLSMPTLASLQLPASLPTTLPSALAEQRPDIQAAMAELKVAAAQA